MAFTLTESLKIVWGITQLERLKPAWDQSPAIVYATRITADLLIEVSKKDRGAPACQL